MSVDSSDQVTVGFTCKVCGGTILELPDDYTDESIARCKNCKKEFGSWGSIKNAAKSEVISKLRSDFRTTIRRSIKGSRFVSFK